MPARCFLKSTNTFPISLQFCLFYSTFNEYKTPCMTYYYWTTTLALLVIRTRKLQKLIKHVFFFKKKKSVFSAAGVWKYYRVFVSHHWQRQRGSAGWNDKKCSVDIVMRIKFSRDLAVMGIKFWCSSYFTSHFYHWPTTEYLY